MVHQEPGLRDAAVALASLYQKFREDTQTEAEKKFSIGRYNSAMRQIALLRQGNLDTVVIACVIFMSIDILCGNHEQALLHYRYGKRILDSYTPNAQIKGIFRQMHMFVLFTSPSGLLLLEKDGCPHITQPFWSLLQAQEELDWLVYRSMEVVYFVNKQCEESIILPAQYELNHELDNWFLAVSGLVSQDLPILERAAFHMLEARWLICKIWCHGSLYGDQGYDDCTDMFRRELELLRELMAMGAPKSTFEIGVPPLLHFLFTKCKDLNLRLSALALFMEKCFTPDTFWDFRVIYENSQRRIEQEHDMVLGSEWAQSIDQETMLPKKKSALTRTAWVSKIQYLCPWALVVLDVSEEVRGVIPL
ncbi:C6 zinc finger protein [Penicillium odoratum]|uniref:C6 zinc finger protein n=1 Tax=Penicillium odoratum TaxID=1167516 RepID=UPI002547815D|nr:C6 zinc finger protein [Penicillium odoratum]KAJ5771682.1 C6 zinc finger protein [Penicillium odoratum]